MRKRVYLDYAASTPVDPRVMRAMQPYFEEEFGNPGSLHAFGQGALAAVDRARETVAGALGADFREIIFTGSATEANNLALRGILRKEARSEEQGAREGDARPPRLIVSSIEHESVLETAKDLEREGVDVVYLPVDKKGIVKLDALRDALTPETVLVSVMHGNNETGAVQPIAKIGKMLEEFRSSKSKGGIPARHPLLHADAAQSFQFLDCNPVALGVDLLTLSGHKIYGPKGVGALYVRKQEASSKSRAARFRTPLLNSRYSILATQTGGNQEFGLRSGTENVPLVAGFAKAVEIAEAEREKRMRHVTKLRDQFISGLRSLPATPPGRRARHGTSYLLRIPSSLPHILNFSLPGLNAGELLMALDLQGVAVSSGSACRSRSYEPSHVLRAMQLPESRLGSSLRASFGAMAKPADVKRALAALKKTIRRLEG